MRCCEMESQGPVSGFCDERAMFKVQNHWYCQFHADALEEAEARWSGINWFPIRYTESHEQPDLNDPDGRFWDDED